MADRIGQQLSNYRLIRLLGQGGFADVYLGEHLHLGTQAAIKVLHMQLVGDYSEKFRTEARTLAQLIHPAIVRVLDFGVEGMTPFLVMDYAPHGSLRTKHPKGTRLPMAQIVHYVNHLASAVQYAHEHQLIHRDVKPENMLLGRRNEVLLTDFGIAIMAPSSFSAASEQIAGSVGYIAPEQILGKPRLASDQYSLGVLVYEWLSGKRPFDGSSFLEVATQHLYVAPPPLRENVPTISPAVEQVVLKALAKDPQQRFTTVQTFAMALEQASASEQPPFVLSPREQRQPQPSAPATRKTKEQWLAEGNANYDAQQFEKALLAYERATFLDPTYAAAYVGKGLVLRNLKRYEEALLAYERATQLDPTDPVTYNNISKILSILQWYSEALRAANCAIQLNPNYPAAYYNQGYALGELKRYEEELAAYDRAIQLDPTFVLAYNGKGVTLTVLKRYEEALAAYDRAIQLAPTFAIAHANRGDALNALKRYEEALKAYDRAIQLDPTYAAAYTNKSRTLETLGRTAEAQQARQKAHELRL